MRYEEPNMEVVMVNGESIVLTSLNGNSSGSGDVYDPPTEW